MKKQTQDLQKNYSALEFEYNESNNQYEELSQIKEKLEKDYTNQQTLFEQEKNAKSLIWESLREFQGSIFPFSKRSLSFFRFNRKNKYSHN